MASLQNELQSNIYKNAKLRTQLFKKVSDQKDNTQDSSANTKFAKQPVVENLPKVGMFRINPDKTSREAKKVPNTVSASVRTIPITFSQPPVITKKDNQKAKVSVKEIQKKYKPKVSKPKAVGTHESLATSKPRKSRLLLRWSPTGRLFNQEGKIVDSSKSKSKSDCSNGDNACTSNTMEPKIKRFPNSTFLLDRIRGFGHVGKGQ
nr:hypothetical protein [Tanacetum cinerariifolium]